MTARSACAAAERVTANTDGRRGRGRGDHFSTVFSQARAVGVDLRGDLPGINIDRNEQVCYTIRQIKAPARVATARCMSQCLRRTSTDEPYYHDSIPRSRSAHAERRCLMSTSKLQQYCKDALKFNFNKYTIHENHRPEWLTNIDTGKPLELDFYIPDLEVGIEVQGRQHVEYTPHFHESFTGFQQQKQRDDDKNRMCHENRVRLYHVFTEKDIDATVWKLRNLELQMLSESKGRAAFKWEQSIKGMTARLEQCIQSRREIGEQVFRTRVANTRNKIAREMAIYEASGSPPIGSAVLVTYLQTYLRAWKILNHDKGYHELMMQCETEKQRLQKEAESRQLVFKAVEHKRFICSRLMSKGLTGNFRAAMIRLKKEWHKLGGTDSTKATTEQLQLEFRWLNERYGEVKMNWLPKDDPIPDFDHPVGWIPDGEVRP